MPSTLRSRIALFVLMTMFLIPVSVSALRGLTHVLTCEDQVETAFSLIPKEDEEATAISATRIERTEPGQPTPRLCGALSVDLRASTQAVPDKVQMTVAITNHDKFPWQGTVLFQVEGIAAAIPIDVGEVGPGDTATNLVDFSLDPGQHEIAGSLLIGP